MSLQEFEKQLLEYSEISTIPAEAEAVPDTIKEYRLKMAENNSTSIFDKKYNLPEDIKQDSSVKKPATEENSALDNGDVTYIISGRGRGGRNYYVKPGKSNTDDDEVRQQIRKLHGIGYSNSITEASVKAHHMGKTLSQSGSLSSSSDLTTECDKLKNVKLDNETYPTVHTENLVPDKENRPDNEIKFVDATEDKSKPLPLSIMLKQSKEEYKKRIKMRKAQESAKVKGDSINTDSKDSDSVKSPKETPSESNEEVKCTEKTVKNVESVNDNLKQTEVEINGNKKKSRRSSSPKETVSKD
ncbi:uncharacterized protein LOC143206496 [Rhynchophorus ferrugineus]|uniref:Uncharacterized protein n=1 Tax=Rhynchophorus ferrugineus TaxID=354439 RepID=A0A834INC4_RHYFE|nr:hypothetical protein GWI33_001596 [Rhynchophorus ferrugineus]